MFFPLQSTTATSDGFACFISGLQNSKIHFSAICRKKNQKVSQFSIFCEFLGGPRNACLNPVPKNRWLMAPMDVGEFSSEASILSIAFARIQDFRVHHQMWRRFPMLGGLGWATDWLLQNSQERQKDQKNRVLDGFGQSSSFSLLGCILEATPHQMQGGLVK